jgi:hypothetical protein
MAVLRARERLGAGKRAATPRSRHAAGNNCGGRIAARIAAEASLKGCFTVAGKISAEHRCALEILSSAGTVGHPLAALLDSGVNRKLIAEIIGKGQAVPVAIKIGVGRNKTRISYVRITDAGRRALVKGDATGAEGV